MKTRKLLFSLVVILFIFHYSPIISMAKSVNQLEMDLEEETLKGELSEEANNETELKQESDWQEENLTEEVEVIDKESIGKKDIEVTSEADSQEIGQSHTQIKEEKDQNELLDQQHVEEGVTKFNIANKNILSSKDDVLKRGVTSDDVLQLKLQLSKLGFVVSSNPNRIFGPKTESTVKDFQRFYGLKETGIVEEKTLKKIDELLNSPLKRGDYRRDVIILKEKLAELGFIVSSNPTPQFGPTTERVVKEFQEYYGLNKSGNVDESMLIRLDEILSTSFRKGQKDSEVITIKEKLSRLGFIVSSNPTSKYGPKTESTVRDFQRFYGLKETGIVEEKTLKKIDELLNSPLKRGDYRRDVIILKEKLAELGFIVSSNPTPQFGPTTERVVKEFQEYYGLNKSGIVDESMLIRLDEILSTSFRKGQKDSEVITIKEKLSRLGFIVSSNPTSKYGPKTESTVRDFQRFYGLKETGIVEEKTLKKIDELLNSPLKRGDYRRDVIILKENLAELGFKISSNPTPQFGPTTERVVKEFQEFYGLNSTGIINLDTAQMINELLSTPLKRGDYRKDVIILKENLAKLGFKISSNPTPQFGPTTERVVKEFQVYYGIKETGIVDNDLKKKINDFLSTPFQRGRSHKDVIKLKKNLAEIGFEVSKNPNENYGPKTEMVVKDFQEQYGLVINGIADKVTLAKIKEALSKRIVTTTSYDVTLKEALNIQMKQLQQTDKYRNDPAYVSAKYIEIIEHGVISSTGNVNLRTSPSLKNNNNIKVTVGNGTRIKILGEVNGDIHANSNKWYKIEYNGKTLYVHSSLANPNGKIGRVTTDQLNVRAGTNTNSHIYGKLKRNQEVTIIKEGNNWHQISYQAWRNPTKSEVENYLNPNNHDEFQHLVLSSSVNVTASELNKVLAGKGILAGKGQAFINGAKSHEVNEIYLISHAFLETGHGTSQLAKGVEVGKDKSDKLVLVTDKNRSSLSNIRTTYNMFGIGAADADPKRLGAIRAYEEGWFTPEAAIEGGAKFIGEEYIHNDYKQNTLYKMRWNPANPGYPQYATDIAWAVKQVNQIKAMYNQLTNPFLHFDIPVYK